MSAELYEEMSKRAWKLLRDRGEPASQHDDAPIVFGTDDFDIELSYNGHGDEFLDVTFYREGMVDRMCRVYRELNGKGYAGERMGWELRTCLQHMRDLMILDDLADV